MDGANEAQIDELRTLTSVVQRMTIQLRDEALQLNGAVVRAESVPDLREQLDAFSDTLEMLTAHRAQIATLLAAVAAGAAG